MCLYPKLIKNRKYLPNKKNGGVVPPLPLKDGRPDYRVLYVPKKCGKCMECMKQSAREWQVRMLEDIKENTNGKFVTLTFSNEELKKLGDEINTVKIITGIKSRTKDKNGKERVRYKYEKVVQETNITGYDRDNAIAKLAVRRFNERWRKLTGKALRHWLVTELGHEGTENIHLHGIVWTDRKQAEIDREWKYGITWIGDEETKGYVNEETVNYIVKYISKADEDHKEYKPVVLTSAGIGNRYTKKRDSLRNKYKGKETKKEYVNRQGFKINMPSYWRNKIYTDEEREKLWQIMLDENKRYVDGIEVDVSKGDEKYYKLLEEARNKSKRLGYGDDSINWDRKKYENERRNMLYESRVNKSNR